MSKKLRWGIIGLGTIAHDWAQNFINNNEHELYAAASRNKEKAQEFCKKYQIKKAYTYDELLADETVDIVYIATPHNLHYQQIKDALNNNKHVFCEKAITLNAKELEEVMLIAEQKQLILLEGTTLFYMPLIQQIKTEITSGKYGPLKMIQATFGSYKILIQKCVSLILT